MTTTKQFQINRLEAALVIAKETNNHRLVATLTPMVMAERVKRNRNNGLTENLVATAGTTARAVYNPKRASIKLKTELYDTRVSAPSEKVVATRLALYNLFR